MKAAYFDCFAGISGDMIIGALLDSGLDFQELEREIGKLNITGYELRCETVLKNGISGKKFHVTCNESQTTRHLSDMEDILNKSSLEREIIEKSVKIFKRIAAVESKIHGCGIDEIHFHEIGAIDSIIDIAGAVIALDMLGIKKIFSSKINLGSGFVNTMHGKIPVPAPATVGLLYGVPVYSTGIACELATPTGAAIISTLAESFGEIPDMIINTAGYGAGTKDLEIPNLLRIIIGEIEETGSDGDTVQVIETNIDDMNPEFYKYVYDRLLENGALDVYTTPIIMKKGRPGNKLSIISKHADSQKLINIIFSETTSSGVRINSVIRKKLERTTEKVSTKYGEVHIKIHKKKGEIITVSPEYDDCEKIAREKGIPLKNVYEEAKKNK